jgi:hypothetical protein
VEERERGGGGKDGARERDATDVEKRKGARGEGKQRRRNGILPRT